MRDKMYNKIYLVYLKIPKSIYNNYQKHLLMGIDKTPPIDDNGDYYVLFYAWTDEKELIKEFTRFRNRDIYDIVKKKGLSDDELTELKQDHAEKRLGRYKFYHSYLDDVNEYNAKEEYIQATKDEKDNDYYTIFVATKNEYVNCSLDLVPNMFESGPASFANIDYSIFKNKYIEVLDILGYTSYFDLYWHDTNPESDDMTDRYIVAGENAESHLTTYGHIFFDISDNEFLSFLYLYKYMIKGRVDNYE